MEPLVSAFGYRYSGEPGAVAQPFPGVRFNPQTGRIEQQRWEGTPEDIAALETALQLAGISYRIAPGQQGGFRTIDVDEPTAETSSLQLFQTDDLDGSDPEKDLLQHESLVTAGATADDLSVLKQMIQDYDNRVETRAGAGAVLAAQELVTPLPSGTLVDLFQIHASGVRAFSDSNWIIRRTAIYAPGAGAITVNNVRKVFETSVDLETIEAIDPNRIWAIPAGQWLKRTPKFQRQRNGTTVFSVEWWWAKQWSTTLYQTAA
ncbi:MAG: hypothetical protein FD161_889 [Limisphaerales bacterium]|nr:MAG: hypothetical protein FD161_889 [Limisphaerales bacterium]KAG0510048.1 MAG: hypothetical protein E1N63_889 [Limisphaerales bacterium]TXT53062.1 MAG: hypothetical protein FD140_170 [Limisphaerales bacterium]